MDSSVILHVNIEREDQDLYVGANARMVHKNAQKYYVLAIKRTVHLRL